MLQNSKFVRIIRVDSQLPFLEKSVYIFDIHLIIYKCAWSHRLNWILQKKITIQYPKMTWQDLPKVCELLNLSLPSSATTTYNFTTSKFQNGGNYVKFFVIIWMIDKYVLLINRESISFNQSCGSFDDWDIAMVGSAPNSNKW